MPKCERAAVEDAMQKSFAWISRCIAAVTRDVQRGGTAAWLRGCAE